MKEAGYIEGQNLAIEYRFADGQYDRLPMLAADLVRRQVAVIASGGIVAAIAANSPTMTIPIVSQIGNDPVRLGLVAGLSRPGGNITGVTSLNVEVVPKLLDLLHELGPTASLIAILVNPASPTQTEASELVPPMYSLVVFLIMLAWGYVPAWSIRRTGGHGTSLLCPRFVN